MNETKSMQKPSAPSRILMLKSHSAGIGDILRSSAAWRALKIAYPSAELHLVFFTAHPGYASEKLIRSHHLLNGFHLIDKRTDSLAQVFRFWREVNAVCDAVHPDLVIDFESGGLRLALVSRWISLRNGAATVGVNAFPGRSLFYGTSSANMHQYANARNLPLPIEYTERDFTVLSALGIERNGIPIELEETAESTNYRNNFRSQFGLADGVKLLGMNIGCGTPDAVLRRPSLAVMAGIGAYVQKKYGYQLVIGLGAPFESEVDKEFLRKYRELCDAPVIDLEGKVTLLSLVGLIGTFDLFISGDSGPYHIAVAVKTPTLAIFNEDYPPAIHTHPWVRCILVNQEDHIGRLTQAVDGLLATKQIR